MRGSDRSSFDTRLIACSRWTRGSTSQTVTLGQIWLIPAARSSCAAFMCTHCRGMSGPDVDFEAIARYFAVTALELGLMVGFMFGVQSFLLPNVSGASSPSALHVLSPGPPGSCTPSVPARTDCPFCRRINNQVLTAVIRLLTRPFPRRSADIGKGIVFGMYLYLSVGSRIFNVLGAKRPSVKCARRSARPLFTQHKQSPTTLR